MSDFIEAGTCDADGCTNEADARPSAGSAGTTNILSVEIVSDAICPWCYIAQRQFERAAAKLPKDVKLSVHWRPFELASLDGSRPSSRALWHSSAFCRASARRTACVGPSPISGSLLSSLKRNTQLS